MQLRGRAALPKLISHSTSNGYLKSTYRPEVVEINDLKLSRVINRNLRWREEGARDSPRALIQPRDS